MENETNGREALALADQPRAGNTPSAGRTSTCWARGLDACAGKMSREHYVTKALFQGTSIKVQGFSWCKDEPIIIGIDAATSKTLCQGHNSRLSPVDVGGAKAFRQLAEFHRLENERRKIHPHRRWNVRKTSIDGLLLERWLTKTAFNLVCLNSTPLRWRANGRPANDPPREFLAALFGKQPMPRDGGLYFAVSVGAPLFTDDSVQFTPLHVNNEVYAGLFVFYGFRILMSFVDERIPAEGPAHCLAAVRDWAGLSVQWHTAAFHTTLGAHRSQKVNISW